MNKLEYMAATILLLTSSSAMACSDGYYSVAGVCVPNSGELGKAVESTVNPITQAGRIIALGNALSSGNRDTMVKALGEVVYNSPVCMGCTALTQTVINNLSKDQINKIVGEGFLTFVGTGNPVLVFIDVATNVIKESQITPPAKNPFSPPPSAIKRQYSGSADCIVKEKKRNGVMAAWKNTPVLKGEDGIDYTFPRIALSEGDTVRLTAAICFEQNNDNQTAIDSITMTYKYSSILPGTEPDRIKFVFYGESGQ